MLQPKVEYFLSVIFRNRWYAFQGCWNAVQVDLSLESPPQVDPGGRNSILFCRKQLLSEKQEGRLTSCRNCLHNLNKVIPEIGNTLDVNPLFR